MLRATALALTLVGVLTAPAQATGLKATQTVEVASVAIAADGSEVLSYAPAIEVEPGEQVRYTLTYVNDGSQPAENVSLVMPVPQEVKASVSGASSAVLFSADAGQSFAARDAVFVGEGERARLATAAEITHIKWDFAEPIEPAGIGTISYEAVLK
jgi:uncharacterized repeat protein (TIGR01451 family)